MTATHYVNKIFDLMKLRGDMDYIGEPVSQIQHMIQAAMLAEDAEYSHKKIMAALLHDIGHLVDDTEQMVELYDSHKKSLGVKDHEKIGANLLRSYNVDEYVCDLVENHANAKRYLVTINNEYRQNLSNASKKTLEYQGGIMSNDELAKFVNSPNFKDYIDLRKIDEMAKEPNKPINDIEYYRDICESLIV
jgi:putative nucleotidyltransferase with HDIG domain